MAMNRSRKSNLMQDPSDIGSLGLATPAPKIDSEADRIKYEAEQADLEAKSAARREQEDEESRLRREREDEESRLRRERERLEEETRMINEYFAYHMINPPKNK